MFKKILKSYVALLFALLCVTRHVVATSPNTVIGIVTDENPATFNSAYNLAVSPNGQKIYVSNLGNSTVSIVDVATNTVIGLVSDPSSTFHGVYGVVFNPNGQTAYVMNSESPYSISIVNAATDTVTGLINTTAAAVVEPVNMAITPNGAYGYVANSDANQVTVVDLATNATTQNITLPVSSEIPAIVITPDGTKAFASTYGTQIYAIDIETNTIIGAVTGTFSDAYGLAITPNGSTLYAANSALNNVTIIDVATNTQIGTVTDLNPATFIFPYAVALTPDGSTLYVLNNEGSSVSIVDTATNQVTGVVTDLNPPTFDGPLSIVVTPNGANGYVSNSNNTVSIFYITTPLAPPTNAAGCQSSDTFLLQQDLVNILTWSAPTSGTAPVAYKIYRDAGLTDLVATVPASGPLKYIDHNRVASTPYTYYIVSVDAQADVSTAVEVVVDSNCPAIQ